MSKTLDSTAANSRIPKALGSVILKSRVSVPSPDEERKSIGTICPPAAEKKLKAIDSENNIAVFRSEHRSNQTWRMDCLGKV